MWAKTTAVRFGLVALLILLASAPAAYQYLASMVSLKPHFGKTETALDFTSAPESASSSGFILLYASLASQLVRQGNYTEAKRLLGMIGGLPANTEQDLRVYLTLLNELVVILDSLKSELNNLQVLVSEGDVAQGNEKIQEIESLIADVSRHLNLLHSSLNRIETIYHIDISTQKHDLDVFSNTLVSFTQLFENLRAQLDAMDHRAPVQLDLQVSPNPVQIEGSLQISGRLRSGEIALDKRVIALWINEIQTTNVTLDTVGAFDWKYLVSNSSRADKVEVYASYSPTGDDVSRFRPGRSANVTVPIDYYPVALTISVTSNRILVLENFTVQGNLTDAFGRPLPAMTISLLVDDKQVNDSVTDAAGIYRTRATLPAGTVEGEHQLQTRFEPKQGIYASAASDKTTIQLYYLRPTISQLALFGVANVRGEEVVVSGQVAQLEGHLTLDSHPFEQGLVIAFLDGNELGRGLSQANGVFRFSIKIPYDASDKNEIEVVLTPAKPWVASSTVSIVLRVLNSAVLSFGGGATVLAVLVFSGKPIDPSSILRRRASLRRRREAQSIVVQGPKVEDRAGTTQMLSVSDFKVELDIGLKLDEPRAYVKTAYWEIRRILAEGLGVRAEKTSETPREYSLRIADRLGDASPSLSALTHAFEIAEYSQHVIFGFEAQEARNNAVRVAEQVNARITH